MTVFWVISGLLIVGALLFILPPLLARREGGRVSRNAVNIAVYRDQLRELEADLATGTLSAEHYEKARREIEARVLEDVDGGDAAAGRPQHGRGAAIALGVAVPLVAAALYLVVGNPQILSPQQTAAGGGAHGLSVQQIEALIERVAARLKANPDDAEGWVILARSYNVLGRFPEAARAYANAVARVPRNAQLLADYADALAMAQGKRLQGEPENIIARALEIDPANVKALALAGSVEFEKKQYASAAGYWERILPLIPQDSDMARSIQASIADARSRAGGGSRQPPRQANAGDSRTGVSGVVKLAPELATKVAPTDTVFIFARAADGRRMPLATLRKRASELPLRFRLDDTMAMSREMKLSSVPQVVVGARISKSSNATPQPGDLQGMSQPVSNRAAGVTVVINSEVR